MIWDGLIVILILTLAVAGWNVGIVNSWRGPIAIVIATVVTQMFYVDFSTWIVQQLRVSPEQAIGIGYVLLWSLVAIVAELLMNVILPFGTKNRPMFFNRLAGAAFGIARGILIVLLPMIALLGPIKVPTAPADKSALVNVMETGINKSPTVAFFNGVAKSLYPNFGPAVVSTKAPSFKPNFAGTTALDDLNKEGQPSTPPK